MINGVPLSFQRYVGMHNYAPLHNNWRKWKDSLV